VNRFPYRGLRTSTAIFAPGDFASKQRRFVRAGVSLSSSAWLLSGKIEIRSSAALSQSTRVSCGAAPLARGSAASRIPELGFAGTAILAIRATATSHHHPRRIQRRRRFPPDSTATTVVHTAALLQYHRPIGTSWSPGWSGRSTLLRHVGKSISTTPHCQCKPSPRICLRRDGPSELVPSSTRVPTGWLRSASPDPSVSNCSTSRQRIRDGAATAPSRRGTCSDSAGRKKILLWHAAGCIG